MKKILLSLSLSVLAASAWAQNAPVSGISESTDPAKVQDVEKRAQDMQSRQNQSSAGASDSSSGKASADSKKKHKKHKKSHAKAKSAKPDQK